MMKIAKHFYEEWVTYTKDAAERMMAKTALKEAGFKESQIDAEWDRARGQFKIIGRRKTNLLDV